MAAASAPRGRGGLPRTSPIFLALLLVATTAGVRADEPEGVELLKTDSQAPYVHRLTLYDHDGKAIDPADPMAGPYSPSATCGKCHPYTEISHGWHFDEPDPNAPVGRPGEPWLLVDERTGTVLPISGRRWPGTWTPQEVGLTDWQFVKRFGGHTPGGGYGAPDDEAARASPEAQRWRVSGRLEIDCMFCHSADQQHDPAEAARQIAAENFRWAPTAALGLAVVRGEARKAPDDWDPALPPNPDYPEQTGPRLVWDKRRFDPDNRVLFNITRARPADRCYFCHTTREVGPQAPDDMLRSRDVHLAAGLVCADCHRNEVNHLTARGYGGEATERGELWRITYSCEGCHLGTERPYAEEEEEESADEACVEPNDTAAQLGGRYAAPHPEHRGLPPVHFEKLTCTACHCGSWPEMDVTRFQTAMSHELGLTSRERNDDTPPRILGPFFALQPDDKIAPQRMIWPAFWGRLDGDKVTPLLPDFVGKVAGKLLPKPDSKAEGEWHPLSDEQVAAVLEALTPRVAPEGVPVYVRSGKVERRTADGGLEAVESTAGAAYCWSFAHDVRPAAQALGVRGCTDCHASDAPFYFGATTTGEEVDPNPVQWMCQLRGEDDALARAWALGFMARPAFKWFGFACAGIVFLLLIRVGLDGRGRPAVAASMASASLPHIEVWVRVIALVGTVLGAVTSFGLKWVGGEVAGYWLLAHMVAAGVFTLGLTLSTLLWTRRRQSGAFSANALRTLAFWLVLTLGLAVLATMLAAMVPVFGTAGQRGLIQWHERTSIGLLIMIVVYGVLAVATRRAKGTTP